MIILLQQEKKGREPGEKCHTIQVENSLLIFFHFLSLEGWRSFCVSFLELNLIRGRRAKSDLKYVAALITEMRAKETRCSSSDRLEIIARLPFNFVLVLSGNF